MRQRVGARATTPCITATVKHGGGSVTNGAFPNCKVGDLHLVKG